MNLNFTSSISGTVVTLMLDDKGKHFFFSFSKTCTWPEIPIIALGSILPVVMQCFWLCHFDCNVGPRSTQVL